MSTTAQTVPVTQTPGGLQLRDRGLERTALLAIIRPAHADRVARRASEDFEARKVRFADRSRRCIVDGVLRSPGGALGKRLRSAQRTLPDWVRIPST
jgi:hypothetical protein